MDMSEKKKTRGIATLLSLFTLGEHFPIGRQRETKHPGSKKDVKHTPKKHPAYFYKKMTNHQRVVEGRAKRMGINVQEYQEFYPQMKTLTRKQLADCLSKIGSLIDSCIALNSKEGYRQARRLGDRYYNILTESRQHPPVSKIKGLSFSSTAIDEFETR